MELFTRVSGDGPPIVMLHGLFGGHENLGAIARPLADEFRIHGIDLRNHGRSPHGAAMDYPTMAADVAETMAAQGLDSASLVGHSMGGKVAMELALTAPERVRALVVLDIAPVAYDRNHDTELDAMRALDTTRIRSRAEADKALAASVPNSGIRQFLLKNLVRDGNGFAWRIPLAKIAEQYASIAAAPSPARYTGPTLFLRGGESHYVRREHETAVRRHFPEAVIETLDDAAHWLHVEAPDEVANHIRQVVARAL